MIIVTGGAGFIGSNLVHELNARGRHDILVVDDLSQGKKFKHLASATIGDYWDKGDFLEALMAGEFEGQSIEAIFHQGANSTTTDWDGRAMMADNFTYSKILFHFALERTIPFIYASSAAVYGGGHSFEVDPKNECPLNVYGYSKLVFDQYVRRFLPQAKSQIVGWRYFNVYGPREDHKGAMASVPFHWYHQAKDKGVIKVFGEAEGYGPGEHRRDFIFVKDVVEMNLWALTDPSFSGIFNLGTGQSRTFNAVAQVLMDEMGVEREYIPFPSHLLGHYQAFTEAHIEPLRACGCDYRFTPLEEGVKTYLNVLEQLP